MALTHPSDPSAQYITTFNGTVAVTGLTNTETHYEITLWLVSGGNYDLQINVSDISFNGTGCSGLSGIPLSSIVKDIANAAVAKSVQLGYPGCGLTAFSKPMRVWCNACAVRSGSNCSTYFSACGSDWSHRLYYIACPGTGQAASITESTGVPSDCSATGCESSYDTLLE